MEIYLGIIGIIISITGISWEYIGIIKNAINHDLKIVIKWDCIMGISWDFKPTRSH